MLPSDAQSEGAAAAPANADDERLPGSDSEIKPADGQPDGAAKAKRRRRLKQAACCGGLLAAVTIVVLLVVFLVVLRNDPQDPNTIVYIGNGLFAATLGARGVGVFRSDGTEVRSGPVDGLKGADCISTSGPWLVVMDFVGEEIAVLDAGTLELVDAQSAPQRTFSGLAGRPSQAVVSGGTKSLTSWSVQQETGKLVREGSVDLGRGQPDVSLDDSRPVAYVSTDFTGQVDGSRFGITILDVSPGANLAQLAQFGVTDDDNLIPDSRAFSPFFALRTASLDGVLAVASLDALTLFSVAQPSSPQRLARFEAGDLGFAPRDVAFDSSSGLLFAVGPRSRPDLDSSVQVQAFNVTSRAPLASVRAEGFASGLAAGGGVVALASRSGAPLFFAASSFSS